MKVECTVCKRTVGVVGDWNARQGQEDTVYRLVRHRANEKKIKGGKQVICAGTGVRIPVPVA